MESSSQNNQASPDSFYKKCVNDDENMQARIMPILNEIQESRVLVKELHAKFGARFSEIITFYRERLDELKGNYETAISELQEREREILEACNELLEGQKVSDE